MDDSGHLLLLTVPDIGLDLHAASRDELVEMVPDFICGLWGWYALAPDDELTASGRRRKADLLQTFEGIA